VGGFDSNFFLYWDDVDISYRLQLAGYKFYSIILNDPLIHSVGGSSKTLISRLIKFYFFYKGKILFLKKHKGFKLATKIFFIT
jgi:GT2 family glycosyltransferase